MAQTAISVVNEGPCSFFKALFQTALYSVTCYITMLLYVYVMITVWSQKRFFVDVKQSNVPQLLSSLLCSRDRCRSATLTCCPQQKVLRGPEKVPNGPQLGRGPRFADHYCTTNATPHCFRREMQNSRNKHCWWRHGYVGVQANPAPCLKAVNFKIFRDAALCCRFSSCVAFLVHVTCRDRLRNR